MNQTTINHKFKKGDKVRISNGSSASTFTIVALEFYMPKDSDEYGVMYQIKNDKNNFLAWVSEDRLEGVE